MPTQTNIVVTVKKKGEEPIIRKIGMGAGHRMAAKAAGHNFVGQMATLADEIAAHLDDPEVESATIEITKEAL